LPVLEVQIAGRAKSFEYPIVNCGHTGFAWFKGQRGVGVPQKEHDRGHDSDGSKKTYSQCVYGQRWGSFGSSNGAVTPLSAVAVVITAVHDCPFKCASSRVIRALL
jgi:hypothetical protein